MQNYVDWYSGAGGTVIKIAVIRDKHDGAVHRLTQTSDSHKEKTDTAGTTNAPSNPEMECTDRFDWF